METPEEKLLDMFGPGIMRYLGVSKVSEVRHAVLSQSYQLHLFEQHQRQQMNNLAKIVSSEQPKAVTKRM
jgi:hypothetical protein